VRVHPTLGIGLLPEQQSRLFKSFSQAGSLWPRCRFGGTGLGLRSHLRGAGDAAMGGTASGIRANQAEGQRLPPSTLPLRLSHPSSNENPSAGASLPTASPRTYPLDPPGTEADAPSQEARALAIATAAAAPASPGASPARAGRGRGGRSLRERGRGSHGWAHV